jgi:3',5'-cyclic AMP phosphodiesterase CpdA
VGGVKFRASLGNHDSREQRYYKLFNMDGELYYTFGPAADVRFFALETTYMEPKQVEWFEKALEGSSAEWKIAFFHHPLYSSGDRHGSHIRLREVLEPLMLEYNVSVVFAGHDHLYERTKPQQGIVHFVVGSGGKLRQGDIENTGITARGYDRDYAFLVAEIAGDRMTFQTITRSGAVVDSGVVTRRHQPDEAPGSEAARPAAPAAAGGP